MFGGGRASVLLETRMLMAPAAASQLIFERVGMEDNTNVATAATATNTAVQVAWLETALSPMEMLRMADPETKTQSVDDEVSTATYLLDLTADGELHTQEKSDCEYLTPNAPKHDVASIVDTVHLQVAQFEATDDIVGLAKMNGRISKVALNALARIIPAHTHVVITATAIRVTIPGTNPRVLKAAGMERTPMPICVLIIKNAVPTHPTCAALVDFSVHCDDCKSMRLIYIPVVRAIFFDISKDWIGDCDLLL